jgi:GNAT superfamily N-acetyltransferase
MVETALVDALDAQLANCRAFWLGYGDDGVQSVCAGTTVYRSGVPSAMYNGVLRVTAGSDLGAATRHARSRLDGLPWVWWVGPDSDEGTAARLLSEDATHIATNKVMAIGLDRTFDVDVPAGLTIAQSGGARDLGRWIRAYAPQFGVKIGMENGVPLEALVRAYERRSDPPGAFIRFEARDDQRVVGTSALLDRCGVAGVYLVTTVETHRGRGIASALTTAALRAGQDRGLRVGTLQATAMGARVYERMGFSQVSEYRLFTL